MKTTTRAAALTFAALTITGVAATMTTGDVTPQPRTVIAEPAPEPAPEEPCPFPYPMAICAPIPPAPLLTDEEREELADTYSAAWNEIEVGR